MYDELIKRLWECVSGECWNCSQHKDSYDGQRTCADNLMKQAADAIEELSKPRWIPVTDRLPEDGTLLGKLICDSEGHIRIATQFARIGLKDKWVYTDLIDMVKFLAEEVSEPISEWEDCTHITHWMPLPNLPAEENANG